MVEIISINFQESSKEEQNLQIKQLLHFSSRLCIFLWTEQIIFYRIPDMIFYQNNLLLR